MCVTIWIIVIIIFLLYVTVNSYEHYTDTFINTPTYTVPHLILYVPVGETKYNYYMHNKLTHIMDHWTGFVQYAKRYMPYLKISKINYATNKINKYSELLPTVVLHNKLNRMIIYHGDITIHNLIRFVNNHS